MAIARRASVTVSIAAEMIGRLSVISRVSRVVTSTPEGITREWPGRSSTSSKVNASVNVTGDMAIGANSSERRCKRVSRRMEI